MKTIFTIIFILTATVSYASLDKSPAPAIEWWLKSQGKFDGSKINTKQLPDGNYEITRWESGVPQPSETEMKKIISDFEKQPKPKTLEERVSDLEKKIN